MSIRRVIIGLGFVFMMRGEALGQTTVEGVIDKDTVWKAEENPYIVTDTLYVGGGATLTIRAGVEVRAYPEASLIIGAPEWGEGTLIVRGRLAAPVLFTAHDPTETGRWKGLWFRELAVPATFDEETGDYLSGSLLQYAVIEHTAKPTSETLPAASIMLRSTPFIHECVIRDGLGSGVFAFFNHNQVFRFINNRIEDHRSAWEGAGLRIVGGRNHVLQGNTFAYNVTSKQGGGVYLSTAGPITLTDNSFEENQASQGGGGIYMVTSENAAADPTEVKGNLFFGNRIMEGEMNAHGAGMFLMGEGIPVSDNRFRNNWLLGRDDLRGGGLYVAGDKNRIQANLFEDNVAQGGGGALGAFASDLVWINDNVFRRNGAAAGSGGAAYVESLNDIEFTGNTLEENDAALVGGGVYLQSARKTVMIGNTLIENRSLASGGGAYLLGGLGRIESNLFDRNHGGRFGGGIYFRQDADGMTTFTRNTIIRNTINNGGGGVYLSSFPQVAADIRFIPPNHVMNNVSNYNGGGVYVAGRGVTLAGEYILDTQATEGKPEKFNFIINNDAQQGSGIYNALPFEEDGSGDVDARLACWGAGGGFVPDRIYDHLDNLDVGMVLFEPTATCCLGGEEVGIACEAKPNRNVLKLTLSGGTPDNIFFVELSTGEATLGTFDENGKGRVRFTDIQPGPGVATITYGCGTVLNGPYDCPE